MDSVRGRLELSHGCLDRSKRQWCSLRAPLDSDAEWLVGLVVTPDDPGLESSIFVVDGEVRGGDICGGTAVGSASASIF